jgi:hypothetical protein
MEFGDGNHPRREIVRLGKGGHRTGSARVSRANEGGNARNGLIDSSLDVFVRASRSFARETRALPVRG